MLDETKVEMEMEMEEEEALLPEAADCRAAMKQVQKRLSALQQRIKAAKIPVIILFEGWGASGKGIIISKLIAELDPRGFKVYTTGAATADERRFPRMRRFWTRIPEYGQISVFDRSWYRDVSISLVEDGISNVELETRYDDILDFERQLTDDGYIVLKFFLKITKSEQKKRFESLEKRRATRWRVTADDWRHHRMYAQYKKAFHDMIVRTDRPWASWITVDAKRKKEAALEVCEKVAAALEAALTRTLSDTAETVRVDSEIKVLPIARLADYDLTRSLEQEEYKKQLDKAQEKLFEWHNLLYQRKIPLIIVYEGWDAAGKGGNIKRLTQGLDPRGYEVIPVAAPTPPELHRQYLWRFWNTLPKDGHIAIYDRSWYGRVMVERIEGFCTDAQWKRAFAEMNRFERQLYEWGAIQMKFWIHIDADEQLRRFEERQNTPEKQWKITDEDWRNREKWSEYETAVDDMLQYTNTEYAPWVVVEGNDKKYARIKTINAVVEQIERYIKL